jgi:4-deoxy-L-threo-5-hexosulose-uronate ketol-isomerase
MNIRSMADPVRYPSMTTAQLRETFLLENLHAPGEIRQVYIDLDRAVVGMAVPLDKPLALSADAVLRAKYFTERRELGVLNIGGAGRVHVGNEAHALQNLDCLYVGRGPRDIRFESTDSGAPAIFYLLSYPAHTSYPTVLVPKSAASPVELGSAKDCNHRTIYKYIYLDGAKSCQLVMGVTHLYPGSAWNTMPAHTHSRRSEIYMYFNLAAEARVLHLMGPAEETRHIVMKNWEAVVSPGWSIHAGVGTQSYSFCWGMGGENQDYSDMDPVPVRNLR